ncbi:MAG: ECF transporter S component [Acutalibacteraceae bacterium]|nr:ECF transporter S component [Acutalibacteraceae bacterium]
MKNQNTRKLTVTAIMGTIGFILMMLEFPLSFIIPSFIKFDFSELPALITAFSLGPWWGVAVCLIKNLLHLFVGSTAGVGELSNFVLGAIFVFVAGVIYKRKKTRKGALIGTLAGAFSMAFISVLTNYFFVYPIYAKMLIPMEAIIGMYQALLPSVDNLFEALLIFNFPFNLVKGLIDAAICFLIYKKLSPVLKVSKK